MYDPRTCLFSTHLRTGMTYQGSMNKTSTGKTCQMWSSDRPHAHDYNWVGNHNYCRNPVKESRFVTSHQTSGTRAWCYTTDLGTKWEYCDIRDCTECDQGREQY